MTRARRLICALAVILLGLTTVTAQAQNRTPGSKRAVEWQPTAGFLTDQGAMFRTVAAMNSYHLDVMADYNAGNNPSFNVDDFAQLLSEGYGWMFLTGHGGPGSLMVMGFSTSVARDQTISYYAAQYPGMVTATDAPGIYGISVNTSFVLTYFQNAGSFIHVIACYGASLYSGFSGVQSFISYPGICVVTPAINDCRTVYENMSGWRGVGKRALGQAIQGTNLSLSGSPNLVLAPRVKATNLYDGIKITNTLASYVSFDCEMYTGNPSLVLFGSSSFDILDATWTNSTTLGFTIKPKYRFPSATFSVMSDTLDIFGGVSSWPGRIALDGNHGAPWPDTTNAYAPNGDPFETWLDIVYGNAAATLESFVCLNEMSGVQVTWVTSQEDGTAEYCLFGADDATGPWTLVHSAPASGPGTYQFFDQTPRPWYKLSEVETTGDTLQLMVDGVMNSFTVEADPPSLNTDSLLIAMRQSVVSYIESHPPIILPYEVKMEIIVPDSLKDVVQPLADLHSSMNQATLVTTLEFVNSRGGVNAYLRDCHYQGLKYVLFAGGSKPLVAWNNPLNWEPYRSGWIKPTNYFGYPQWNILDLPVVQDSADTQANSQAWWTSFWPNYQSLVDFDGDQIADMRFGVLPAHNRAELTLMVAKQMAALQQPTSGSSVRKALMLNYAVDSGKNLGSVAQEYADSLIAYLPASFTLQRLTATNAIPYTYTQREAMAIQGINNQPGMIFGYHTLGNRSKGWIDQTLGWSWSKVNPTNYFQFYFGLSCGQADDVRPYDPAYNAGFLKKAMMDLQHGPYGGVGPDAGSFQYGNFLAGKHSLLRAYESGCASAGDAWFLGNRDVVNLYPEWKSLMTEYVFFGDPLIQLPEQVYSENVGVADEVHQSDLRLSVESPARGQSVIQFSLPRSGSVNLDIYDVSGRHLVTLLSGSQQAGTQRLEWQTSGHSGLVFVRLRMEGRSLTQKIIIVH